MQKYDDKQNAQGVYIIFLVVQMILLSLVYAIVYASFRATQLAVEKYQLNEITAFAPTVIAFIAVPVLLYRTRKMFKEGSMMMSIFWMMALLSVFLVGLLVHISNISQI